ncbi:MAG: YihY/virulence factor BrkB family protein [Chloroflexi bacterium]|nr:YihY/virulence factor BrkB family protein [Chloroflexota bacterium]MBP8055434.1 YihY/virulence factor BrkB family protein [Chloroflexota bacterium]
MLEIRRWGEEQITRLNGRSRGWLGIFFWALYHTLSAKSYIAAASIAYFTLFSLFPLILLAVAIASLWLDPLTIEGDILAQLEFIAPGIRALLGDNLVQIVAARSTITSLAVITFLWGSSNIFWGLTRTLDEIWSVDGQRSGWRHRGLAILLALGLTVLLLVASLSQSATSIVLNRFVPEVWQRYRAFTSMLFSVGLDVFLFGLLYLYVPHRKLRWRDVIPGAIAGGVLWELAKRVFVLFLTSYLTLTNLLYGSVTALMAFLFWSYSTGLIFQFGAYLNVEYVRYRLQQEVRATET